VLDLNDFIGLPGNRATALSARKIKHLARLTAAFAQCYPQKSWTAEKVLCNHALAALS
jgi:hypothetical protein